jgi:thioredoxin 1
VAAEYTHTVKHKRRNRSIALAVIALVIGAWIALPSLIRYPGQLYDGGGEVRGASDVSDFMAEYDGADTVASLKYTVEQKPRDQLVVVMFHATWCPYCRRLTQHLIAAESKTREPFSVIKVDVEKYPALSANLQSAQGVPETFIYRNAGLAFSFSGSPEKMDEVVKVLNGL